MQRDQHGEAKLKDEAEEQSVGEELGTVMLEGEGQSVRVSGGARGRSAGVEREGEGQSATRGLT